MKIEFDVKYKTGQKVYIIELYSDGYFRVDEMFIAGYVYYNNNNTAYYILENKYAVIDGSAWYSEDELYTSYKEAIKDREIKNGN